MGMQSLAVGSVLLVLAAAPGAAAGGATRHPEAESDVMLRRNSSS